VIDVAGDGVGPHGPHGINFTGTPASALPFASSTTVPLAFVTLGGGGGVVDCDVGVLVGGVPPPPPPPHAASAAAKVIRPAIIRKRERPHPEYTRISL
jgi:hypothetical protein